MSNSSNLRATIYHEFLQAGDVVVGSYTNEGKQLKNDVSADSEQDISNRREALARSAAHGGGLLLNNTLQKNKAGKPIKAKKRAVVNQNDNPEPLTPDVTARELERIQHHRSEQSTQIVYLHNALGKIKMKVEAILNTDMAFCLVFSNEDELIFTPNAGETLNFIDNRGDTHKVYFANLLFNWTDGSKQLMILIKREE